MKLFITTLLIVAASAGRLDNSYLPPSNTHADNGHRFTNMPSQNNYGGNVHSHHTEASHVHTDESTSNASKYPDYSNDNGDSSYPNVDVRQNFNNAENPDAKAAIVRFTNENNGDGSYNFEYETENGIYHQESGELKNAGVEDEESIAVKGSYSFMAPDGIMYTVNYIADENGYRATGEHIPTAPPVPEAIQEALEKMTAYESDSHAQPEYSNNQVHPKYPASKDHGNEHKYASNKLANSNDHHTGYPSSNEQAAYPSFDSHKYQDNESVAVDAATKPEYKHMGHVGSNPSFNQDTGYHY